MTAGSVPDGAAAIDPSAGAGAPVPPDVQGPDGLLRRVDAAQAGLNLAAPAPSLLLAWESHDGAGSLARVTHLGIGAHQDDLEFMAFHGIQECLDTPGLCFGGVTCTDGAGSTRTGPYAGFSDAQMAATRLHEQEEAARIGRYGAMLQLGYSSAQAKSPTDGGLREDLLAVLRATRPRRVYMHNLADKQETHVAVALATLDALRALPREERPTEVWGCEVWRDLDWLADERKVVMDVSEQAALGAALAGIFVSQLCAKRYDLAVLGRRAAHATLSHPVKGDEATQLIFGMDLTPLVQDVSLDPAAFMQAHIRAFEGDVLARLARYTRIPGRAAPQPQA